MESIKDLEKKSENETRQEGAGGSISSFPSERQLKNTLLVSLSLLFVALFVVGLVWVEQNAKLFFSKMFETSYLIVIVPTALVVTTALLSAKETGGTLGQGLKKIAAGSIIDTILIMTYVLLERGNRGLLDEGVIQAFFLISGLAGSILLILGYLQIYRITKQLRLFTVN